jgi:hypothetical protein
MHAVMAGTRCYSAELTIVSATCLVGGRRSDRDPQGRRVMTHAANMLGMAPGTVSEWFARRTLEIGSDDSDDEGDN